MLPLGEVLLILSPASTAKGIRLHICLAEMMSQHSRLGGRDDLLGYGARRNGIDRPIEQGDTALIVEPRGIENAIG